jgi:hypothetical protein
MTDIEHIIFDHTQTSRMNAAERRDMKSINDGQINRLRDIAAALKRKWAPGDITRARGVIETIVAEIDAAECADCMVQPLPQTMARPELQEGTYQILKPNQRGVYDMNGKASIIEMPGKKARPKKGT